MSYDSLNKVVIGPIEEKIPDELINSIFVSIDKPEFHAYSVQERTGIYGDNEYTENAGIINVFTFVGDGIDIDQSELEYEMKLKLFEFATQELERVMQLLEGTREVLFND